MSMDDDVLPEEDELMDRCMEFTNLITHKAMKDERDALFHFIAMASGMRAKEELRLASYTDYPTLYDVCPAERLEAQHIIYTGEQERFVNLVLQVLKKKKTISMTGSRYA